MSFSKIVMAICAAISLSATGAQALSMSEAAKPAELPPTSFSGNTYVDSRGCVYLRASSGGAVAWVARVTRAGTVMCDATPTLKAAREQRTPMVANALLAQHAVPTGTVARTIRVNCPAFASVSQARTGDGLVIPVRCEEDQAGPKTYFVDHDNGERTRVIATPPGQVALVYPNTVQAAPLFSAKPSEMALGTDVSDDIAGVPIIGERGGYPVVARKDVDKLPAKTRVAPPTYPASNVKIIVPDGYRLVWKDDRLNPDRGVQTVEGMRKTRMIWTDTVPRRLVTVTEK